MNFQWTVSSGQIALACSFLVLAWRLSLIHKSIIYFVAEHEALVEWYAETHQIDRDEMRQRSLIKQKSMAARNGR